MAARGYLPASERKQQGDSAKEKQNTKKEKNERKREREGEGEMERMNEMNDSPEL